MVKLFIIADDLTGALDTGVKFSENGLHTVVVPLAERAFSMPVDENVDVLVVNADSRCMTPLEAYDRVYRLALLAKKLDAEIIYKKVDSALRGNIGSELSAMLDAGDGENVTFVPAYPQMNRYTFHGIQYIDGIPLAESVFADDPFNRVTSSCVRDIIVQQAPVCACSVQRETPFDDTLLSDGRKINIFDARTVRDIDEITQQMAIHEKLHLLAGCAGFAESLAKYLQKDVFLEQRKLPEFRKIFIICGSLNQITQKQINYEKENGTAEFRLSHGELLNPAYWSTEDGLHKVDVICESIDQEMVIVDTQGMEILPDKCEQKSDRPAPRRQIADSLGVLSLHLLERLPETLVVITGGDTLMGLSRQLNDPFLEPVCEVLKGVVMFRMSVDDRWIYGVSKAGGFGATDVYRCIENRLCK